MSGHVTWHWVALDDEDLALIEEGPVGDEVGVAPSYQDLLDWIHDVQEAVLESLETA